MIFSALHILLAFGTGFFFGSIFGVGIFLKRKDSAQKEQDPNPPQNEPKQTPSSPLERKVQTIDIPGIGAQSQKEEVAGDSISFSALTPASISPIGNDENNTPQADDATVLMQRPPPK